MVCTYRQRLVVGICTIVIWCILFAFSIRHFSNVEWISMCALLVLLVAADQFNIELPNKQHFTFETVFFIGFAFIYPIRIVLLSGILAAIILAIQSKRNWIIAAVNMTGLTLCTLAGRMVYDLLAGPQSEFTVRNVVPIISFCVGYIFMNLSLVVLFFCIFYRRSVFSRIRTLCTTQLMIVYSVSILMGILLACVIQSSGVIGSVFFASLVLLISYSYQRYFRLMNHYRQLSIIDELTGTHNHRYIQSTIDKYIAESKPFTLLMVDIDNFKSFNEKHGYIHGDEALCKLAATLTAHCSKNESIARYGGEEFTILTDETNVSQVKEKAETIRRSVAAQFRDEAGRREAILTVSIGIVQYPMMAQDKTTLFMMLDEALYKSKMTGRNKVSIFTTVLDEIKRQMPFKEINEDVFNTIKAFLAILNSKDRYTYAHTERDVIYAEALAKRIGLDESKLQFLRFGAFLHDVGKIEIPNEILTKQGPLTSTEWELMKAHAEIGERIAKPISELGPCLPIIRHHHERFDGTGYPDGIRGENIPIEARILTLADSFDAMTTSRPYQKKRSLESAISELRRCAGTQFDPILIEPFIESVLEIGILHDNEREVAG